jgi:DNA-binding transcriptional ArsR family regulator
VTIFDITASKLKVMGHPIRLQILDMLRRGETCVCHIERAVGKRQAYVSQHLMTMRDAGLVQTRKDGLRVYYRLADDEIPELLTMLLGTPDVTEHDVLEDCPCPVCSTTLIAEIG